MELREAAQSIISAAIRFTLPDEAVVRALRAHDFGHSVYLVAIGKAAWQMARAACDYLGEKVVQGIVITKYGHVKGELPRMEMWEAGHPVPDENSCRATARAMQMVGGLTAGDTVLFLVSGGGSSLFESPLVPLCELKTSCSPAGPTSARSTPFASGFPRSRAGALPKSACRRACIRSCSRTSSAIRWI